MSSGGRADVRNYVAVLLTQLRGDASKLELTLPGGGPALFDTASGWISAESIDDLESPQRVWDFVLLHASADGEELREAVGAVRSRLSPDALVGLDSPAPVDRLPGYSSIPSAGESLLVFKQTRDAFQSRTVVTIVPVRAPDGELEVFVQRRVAGGFPDAGVMRLLEFPQGHLEVDEDPLMAGARELREEAGFELGQVHGSPSQSRGTAEVSRPFAVVSSMSRSGLLSLAYVATVVSGGGPLSAVESHGEWMGVERLKAAHRAGGIFDLNDPLVEILVAHESELAVWAGENADT